MKYKVWVKGMKATTIQTFDIPPYSKDGSAPTMMKIRDVACKSGLFNWADYKNLRYARIPTKMNP